MSKRELLVINSLQDLDIPAHLKGYAYLKSAMSLINGNPSIIYAVMKELYPSIAGEHNTEPTRVERGIRHALTFITDNPSVRRKVLGTARLEMTNSEFIATLNEAVEIKLAMEGEDENTRKSS